MFDGNAIVMTETGVFEAYLSNIWRVMSEKLDHIFGTSESAAWMFLAFSVIAIIAYMVVRCRKSRDSNLATQT